MDEKVYVCVYISANMCVLECHLARTLGCLRFCVNHIRQIHSNGKPHHLVPDLYERTVCVCIKRCGALTERHKS